MPVKIVKPFLLMMVVFLLFLESCGFQINRNRVSLPGGAQSIALSHVSNQSFTPGLDVILKEILMSEFSRNAIPVTSQKSADLKLEFKITQSTMNKEKIILNAQTTYYHLFVISGNLMLIDGRTEKKTMESTSLTGSFLLEISRDQPTEKEIVESRVKAINDLSKVITAKLTQNF